MTPGSLRWRPVRWIGRGLGVVLGLAVIALAVSALSNLGLPTRSDGDLLTAEQRGRAAESLHLRQRLGDRVWPGWGTLHIPQIVYNQRHAFLVGYPGPPPDGWYREPAHEPIGGPWRSVGDQRVAGEPVYRLALPDGVSPQAFTVRVGDRWTGSMPTLEWSRVSLGRQIRDQLPPVLEWIPPYRLLGRLFFRGPEHQVSLSLHETFHAFQAASALEHFAAAEGVLAVGSDYPWDRPEIVAAWQEELGLLADAIEAPEPEEKERFARAFLEARSRRRAGLSAELRDYENRREWLEGLAKYVELEIWWAADTTASYRPVAEARETGFGAYSNASDAFDQEIGQLRRSASQGETLFYYSGMAQAKLLDQLGPDWKGAAIPGGRFLEDLLRETVGPPAPGDDLALAVITEANRLGQRELWPEFDLSTVPVALHTGGRTYLVRHPSPPDGFGELAGSPDVWVYPERHPAVTANTSAELGGHLTATVIIDDAGNVRSLAALLVHEMFHVYQRQRHPTSLRTPVLRGTGSVSRSSWVLESLPIG